MLLMLSSRIGNKENDAADQDNVGIWRHMRAGGTEMNEVEVICMIVGRRIKQDLRNEAKDNLSDLNLTA